MNDAVASSAPVIHCECGGQIKEWGMSDYPSYSCSKCGKDIQKPAPVIQSSARDFWAAVECLQTRYRQLLVPILKDLSNGHIELAQAALNMEVDLISPSDPASKAAYEYLRLIFPNEPPSRVYFIVELVRYYRSL